jgi:hypothetical protein
MPIPATPLFAGTVFLVLIFCYCCCRGFKRPDRAEYHKAEVELSNGGFSSYKDSGSYTDDAEYGEFEANGNGLS